MPHLPLVAAPKAAARRPKPQAAGPVAGPHKPVRRQGAGVRWDGAYWLACAGFALVLASVTTQTTHRLWGACAAVGYAGAAVWAWRAPRRWDRTGALVAVAGAVAVPLVALLAAGQAQAEVHVVEHSADLLLSIGSPYAPHPVVVDDFNPYLPGMALLGLPHALLGDSPLGDARLWFAAVFFASLALAARRVVRERSSVTVDTEPRPSVLPLVAAFPAVALPLAVGGIDLPVIGLMCLGLALAGRPGSGTAAGLAMGAAAALKWTAWPLLPVGLALIAATAGRRAALRAAGTALAVSAVAVVPSALVDPHAFVEHVVLFPLGAGGIGSPATSPLPGYLLAHQVPGGRTLAVAALAASAVAMAVSLVVRPPRTVVAAADRLALGLGLAMCLMPATRFGYFVYPLVLFVWFRRERLRAPAAEPVGAALRGSAKRVDRIGVLVTAGEGARA